MVASNLKMQKIPVAITRVDVIREMKRMLDNKLAKTYRQIRKYENDHNRDGELYGLGYADGMEYALACILSLDEEYEKVYSVKHTVEVGDK